MLHPYLNNNEAKATFGTTGAKMIFLRHEAMRDDELPFVPLVSRRRPHTSGDLLVRAKTPTFEATHGYSLRDRPPRDRPPREQ